MFPCSFGAVCNVERQNTLVEKAVIDEDFCRENWPINFTDSRSVSRNVSILGRSCRPSVEGWGGFPAPPAPLCHFRIHTQAAVHVLFSGGGKEIVLVNDVSCARRSYLEKLGVIVLSVAKL